MRILIGAGETSGDLLGAELIGALRERADDTLELFGIGGPAMAAEGVESPIDIDGLAILGLFEGLRHYPTVLRLSDASADFIAETAPDVCVLIDSWGWTQRVAERLRKRGYTGALVKYVGPQVWATRPGRARKIAAVYDALLAINPMDAPYYEGLDIEVRVVGNPHVTRDFPQMSQADARTALGLPAAGRILAAALGSRTSEIERMEPVLREAACALAAARPDVTLVSPVAESVAALARERLEAWPQPVRIVSAGERWAAFQAADAALATSGTITTEIGLCGAPVVVGYRTGPMTAFVGLRLLQSDFVTLMNVAAGAEIAPEFLQGACTAEAMAREGARLLDDPEARALQIEAQYRALALMGRGAEPPAGRAAAAVLDIAARRA